ETELLADDREDEVGVREREEEEFLPASAETVAEPASRAHGDERLDRLEALAERIRLGVEKRQDPGSPVVGREYQGREGGDHREQPIEKKTRPRARDPEQHGAEH